RMRVLQREIPVARLMPLVIRDLPLHVQCEKFRLQRVFDPLGQLGDRKHTPLGEERGKQFGTGFTHTLRSLRLSASASASATKSLDSGRIPGARRGAKENC